MERQVIVAVVLMMLVSACEMQPVEVSTAVDKKWVAEIATYTSTPTQVIETVLLDEPKWTNDELQTIALTLAGECYDDKGHDKRLVCEVILNRVSDGSFGDSICDVITAENQFLGYEKQSRPVTEHDLLIAEQTLEDWFENDCKALSEYLFFCAGENRENSFY